MTTSNALRGSLIICTRNRATKLVDCLASLESLVGAENWEFVIVDNGSSDHTQQVIAEHVSRVSHRLVTVVEPRQGLGRARNTGISASHGDILAFTDDDCYPAPDFLTQVLRVFEDETLGYIGGRILLHNDDDAPISIRPSMEVVRLPPRTVLPSGLIQGANMAARRRVIEEIGPFDPDLGAGTLFPAEDLEFVLRASEAGWPGGYFPGPLVYHDHGRSDPAAVKRILRQYDLGRGACYAKFILRPDTRRKYGSHWWWSVDFRKHKRRFINEMIGAVRYTLAQPTAKLYRTLTGKHLKSRPSS